MVSSTRQTERRRNIRARKMGSRKKKLIPSSTPAFPLHPEGYDSAAADAKKTPSA
jgi:hypothetical protein